MAQLIAEQPQDVSDLSITLNSLKLCLGTVAGMLEQLGVMEGPGAG